MRVTCLTQQRNKSLICGMHRKSPWNLPINNKFVLISLVSILQFLIAIFYFCIDMWFLVIFNFESDFFNSLHWRNQNDSRGFIDVTGVQGLFAEQFHSFSIVWTSGRFSKLMLNILNSTIVTGRSIESYFLYMEPIGTHFNKSVYRNAVSSRLRSEEQYYVHLWFESWWPSMPSRLTTLFVNETRLLGR